MKNIKVAVFGEALFDMIEQNSGKFAPHIGGSPYNVARSFARQGLSCLYLSPISIDNLGDRIFNSVQKEGIQLPVGNRSSRPTSMALVFHGRSCNVQMRPFCFTDKPLQELRSRN